MLIARILSCIPCPLCGEIHEVKIHGYFLRKVRNPESWENEEIRIFAIFCKTAKGRGGQYTKRILPAFVSPECNIMVEYVLVYLARNPQQRINYEKASLILGAKDPRTIRKHILAGRKIIEKTTVELTRVLSGLPGFGRLPERKPGTTEHEALLATVDELNGAACRMEGAVGSRVAAIGYVHAVYVFHRARNPPQTPLNHVLANLPFFDTS